MLTILLATVDPAHAADAGPIEGLKQTFAHFGVEWHYLVWQIVSFLILFGVLYKFGIKPTIATMEERNKKIGDGLRYTEEMQAKLAASHQESAVLIKTAQQEAQKVVDEARRAAKEFGDRQNTEATARAADTFVKAQQAIELEHKKMLNEARSEIARLVVKTTEQVLAKKLSEADRSAYNEAASKELSVS